MGVRTIIARYAGECVECHAAIAVGDTIKYGGRGAVACAGCELTVTGPTYRERREARAARLRGYAEGREAKADAAQAKVDAIAGMIPFGQPILVGHHSEKRARRDQDRIHAGMHAAVEHGRTARRMVEKADNIERAAAHAIYSDDPDAIERLNAKIAGLEACRDERKAMNAAYRKAHRDELKALTAYGRDQAMPFPGYAITNMTGNLGRLRKRLEQLKREAI